MRQIKASFWRILTERPGEDWEPVSGHENYMVSSHGRAYSKKTRTILTDHPAGRYVRVVLDGGKCYLLHRLVAISFVPKRIACDFVNHKDGNRTNNCAENLEWVTHAENMRHAADTGLYKRGPRTKSAHANHN